MAITSIIRNLNPKVAKSFLNKKFLSRQLKPTEKINIGVTKGSTCIEKATYSSEPGKWESKILSLKGVLASIDKECDTVYNEINAPNYLGSYFLYHKKIFDFTRKFLKNNKVVKYVKEVRTKDGSYSYRESTKNGKIITQYIKEKEPVNGKVNEKIVKTYFADKNFSLATELYDKNKKLLETHIRILGDYNSDFFQSEVTFVVNKPNEIKNKIEKASLDKYRFGSDADFKNLDNKPIF